MQVHNHGRAQQATVNTAFPKIKNKKSHTGLSESQYIITRSGGKDMVEGDR